jgi:hypothetical protein
MNTGNTLPWSKIDPEALFSGATPPGMALSRVRQLWTISDKALVTVAEYHPQRVLQ